MTQQAVAAPLRGVIRLKGNRDELSGVHANEKEGDVSIKSYKKIETSLLFNDAI